MFIFLTDNSAEAIATDSEPSPRLEEPSALSLEEPVELSKTAEASKPAEPAEVHEDPSVEKNRLLGRFHSLPELHTRCPQNVLLDKRGMLDSIFISSVQV